MGYPGMSDDARAAGRLARYGVSTLLGLAMLAFIGFLAIAVFGVPLYALVKWVVGLF